MAKASPKRTRGERVAALPLPPGRLTSLLRDLQRGPVLLRLAICLVAAIVMWVGTFGWQPPLDYRLGQIPHRDVVARVSFTLIDEVETEKAREQARQNATAVYDQDPRPLVELKARVLIELAQITGAPSFEAVDEAIWQAFRPKLAEGTPEPTEEEELRVFAELKQTMAAEGAAEQVQQALDAIFAPLEQKGVLEKLPDERLATSTNIIVRQTDDRGFPEQPVPINDVLLVNVRDQVQRQLEQQLPSPELARRLFARLRPAIPATLTLNEEATLQAREAAAAAVPPKLTQRAAGDVLAPAGVPISAENFALLQRGHAELLAQLSWRQKVARSLAVFGMYLALYTLCGFYTYKLEPRVLQELPRFIGMITAVVLTVLLMYLTFHYNRQAEVIPLLLFGMTIAVAYSQPLALLLSTAVMLIGVFSTGMGVHQGVVLIATTAGAIIVLDTVRTRSKLLAVGFVAAGVAFLTNIGVGTLMGDDFLPTLQTALWLALWAVIASALMTCILPLVEKLFSVQTDLSLLELGDPAHPLLQELVRRAPGTYNHSINVASLAEAAAESIGARGLLVRVGAYFHDIGKMLKPGYFVENQGQGDNRHDALVPAMSTLVIIAHVKDGADLARQYKLPEPIIDFIQQHHGTTLVEYFYRQAADRREVDPHASEVDESSFRYPGPKPQTKEAGVLMLADAVESASRVLVEPTPARIENLVGELSRKRLLDGQFDECGLTLEEVSKIGDSLVKSLTAVYHGRVKYPNQVTA